MKSVSNEFRKKIVSNREFLYKANITFSDGSKLELSDKNDLMSNGISITSATSGTDSFDIGAAVMGELVLTLNNSTGKFDKYNFLDAEINLKIGLQLENSVEYLQMGIYTVDEAQTADITIVLSALDRLSWFEKAYSNVKTAYPATLYQIVSDVCKYCGVSFTMGKFDHGDMVIQKRPDDSELSCLEVISYAAQISGCYAVADEWGRMFFKWYDTGVFENALHLDGGKFRDFTSGDLADGGDFTDYSSDGQLDGGTFADQREFAHIYSMSSMTVGTDEIVVTGIRVAGNSEDATEEGDEGQGTEEENTGYLYGEEGYVLAISENPFITVGMENEIAAYLGRKIIGMKIRTFSVSAVSNPSIEAGDCAYISDRKGNSYPVYITNVTFKLCDYEEFSCGAESPGRNRASGSSAATKAIIAARKEIKRQITTYDLAVQQLTNLITNSFGVFKTEEAQEDGSVIYYLHNKPELSTSSTIWKMTSDAFAVSTDGGKTWNAGIDSSGNAVVNILNAIGINADWINAGDISVGGSEANQDGKIKVYDSGGKLICSMDKEGIKFDVDNLKLDENGNMELWGDINATSLYVKDKIYISSNIHPGLVTEGTIVMESGVYRDPFSNNLGMVGLKVGTNHKYAILTKVYTPAITTGFLSEGKERVLFEGGSGTIDGTLSIGKDLSAGGKFSCGMLSAETCKIIGKSDGGGSVPHCSIKEGTAVYMSGPFVTVCGTVTVENLDAGDSISCMIETASLSGLPDFSPRHSPAVTYNYTGKMYFAIKINTDGELIVKNCGTTDCEMYKDYDVAFRLDYFLM